MSTEQNKSPPKEKVIERLKKLFALGQSSNQHEAELAMAKANEIMTEYQISATDVDLHEDGEVIREEMELDGGRRSTWLQSLAMACARLYDAKAFYSSHGGPNLILRFYGTPADILAAKITFNHLHASWKTIVGMDIRKYQPSDTKTFKRSHGVGFTKAIADRVGTLVSERQSAVKSATGRDLVLVKGAALDDFLSGMKIKNRTQTGRFNHAAYQDGIKHGESIPLHGGIVNEKPLMISR